MRHSNSDAIRQTITVFGRMAKNSPEVPVMRSSGKNAAQDVLTAETTGQSTSSAPLTIASRRSSPSSTLR